MARKSRQSRRHRNPIPPPKPYRVLLPVTTRAEAEALLPLAEALVRDRQGQLIVSHVVSVPEGHSLSEGTARAIRTREALNEFLAERGYTTVQVKTVVRVAREIWEGIWETVAQEEIDLLLLGWHSQTLPETAVGELVDRHLAAPPCDVVIVRPGSNLTGAESWQEMKRILLPVRGGPHAGLALRVANALAEAINAEITLLHVSSTAARDEEERVYTAFAPALRGLDRLTEAVTRVGNVPEQIVEEAKKHQVIVMGAPSRRVPPDGWVGPILEAVVKEVDTTLIVAKNRSPVPAEGELPGAPADLASADVDVVSSSGMERPIAVVVDKWFAENTFHSREFADLERLLALKEEQGVTISLGLPALNEEETVGNVIQTIKSALMEQVPLLDEMVLIDSGSVDYTREIAADLGIPVYIHHDVLPQRGAYHGKGEALWKSLFVLNGDIIAWIDTDIKNIHPRFVFGVLGPLLREPRIKYVKGFYRRPLRQGDKLIAGGGGRVTELTARPLLNLFFPELSGLIQPLSGEYAGRREALERLPFFTGYGVETGLLIDFLEVYGLHSIAQVDLLERIHHNQPLPSLSKMAFAIIQVVVRRLEDRHKIRLLEDVNKTMNLVRYEPRRFYLEAVEIRERERPPMITIPEYREKRGLPPLPDKGGQIVGLVPKRAAGLVAANRQPAPVSEE